MAVLSGSGPCGTAWRALGGRLPRGAFPLDGTFGWTLCHSKVPSRGKRARRVDRYAAYVRCGLSAAHAQAKWHWDPTERHESFGVDMTLNLMGRVTVR